jgi:hypothetical protein
MVRRAKPVSNHEATGWHFSGLILRDALLCSAPQDEGRGLNRWT